MGNIEDDERANWSERVRLTKRLQVVEDHLGKLAAFITPNTLVWYEASPGKRFAAVVDEPPRELGSGQWCVRLRDLDEAYRKYHPSGHTTVAAAATWCLSPREGAADHPFPGLGTHDRPGEVRIVSAAGQPDRCPVCEWSNGDLLNYGEPGKPRWMCHPCAARAIQATEAHYYFLVDDKWHMTETRGEPGELPVTCSCGISNQDPRNLSWSMTTPAIGSLLAPCFDSRSPHVVFWRTAYANLSRNYYTVRDARDELRARFDDLGKAHRASVDRQIAQAETIGDLEQQIKSLRRLLDDIDARDSLAYLEAKNAGHIRQVAEDRELRKPDAPDFKDVVTLSLVELAYRLFEQLPTGLSWTDQHEWRIAMNTWRSRYHALLGAQPPPPEIKHRFALARSHAGLSIGQAARILGVDRRALETIEESPETDAAFVRQMAEKYQVNIPWLIGETPLRDYTAMAGARGSELLTDHDRDVIAEFAASLPRGAISKKAQELRDKIRGAKLPSPDEAHAELKKLLGEDE